MAGIPGELIFVMVFVAFSFLEGLGRKKKAEREGAPGRVPGPQRRPAETHEVGGQLGAQRGGQSGAQRMDQRVETMDVASEPGGMGSRSEPASSEGIIPSDVWEEILGLARGTPPKPVRVEEPVEEAEEVTSWTAYRSEGTPEARIEDSHIPVLESVAARPEGTVRGPSKKRALSVPAPSPSREHSGGRKSSGTRRSVRQSLFGDGSAEELRKAFILQEVLGPPVSMKE